MANQDSLSRMASALKSYRWKKRYINIYIRGNFMVGMLCCSSAMAQSGESQCGQLGVCAIMSQVQLVASSVTSQTLRNEEVRRASKLSLRQDKLGQKYAVSTAL